MSRKQKNSTLRASALPLPARAGRGRIAQAIRVRGMALPGSHTCHARKLTSPSPQPSPRKRRLSYSHILRGSCTADSVGQLMIRGSERCLGLNTGWGGSMTAAWKKGGRAACGTGWTARLVYPPAGWNARPRDSIYAFSAQQLGNGGRNGGPRSGAHGIAGCRA